MNYAPAEDRYNKMTYRKCGNSGLKLPAISLAFGITLAVIVIMNQNELSAKQHLIVELPILI